MVAVSCMYSTVIPHDACIVLSSRTILQETSSLRRWGFLFILFVGSPGTGFRATGTPAGKKRKNYRFGLTLNYRFGEVSMLAETVYFLRKNSINLSTFAEKKVLTCLLFCGKDRQFVTFSQKRYKQCSNVLSKRYKRYKRYTFESKESSIPAFSVITPTFDHFTTYFSVFFSTFMANLNDKI